MGNKRKDKDKCNYDPDHDKNINPEDNQLTCKTQHIICPTPTKEIDFNTIPAVVTEMNNNNVHASALFIIPGYVPQQIKQVYGISQVVNNVTGAGTGKGQIIAIVNAYNYPSAISDLNTFSLQFGLPTPNLITTLNPMPVPPNGKFNIMIYKMSSSIPTDNGWALEQSLDTQWAHAIAPNATILLVQATNNTYNELFRAINFAVSAGANIVSMSWGSNEFSFESLYDKYFNINKNIVFIASSGDSPGVMYPSASPYVLSVGGTNLTIKNTNGVYSRNTEVVWYTNQSLSTGGGVSSYENKVYQSNINSFARRTTPDVSFDADPQTGVAVYNSLYNWIRIGGTSLSAPIWAGIIALSNQRRLLLNKIPLSNKTLATCIYKLLTNPTLYSTCFYDITFGKINNNSATPGYDALSGLGVPKAPGLLAYLDTV